MANHDTPDPRVPALEARLDAILRDIVNVRSDMRDARGEMLELRRAVDQMPVVVQRAIDQKLDLMVTADAFGPVRALVYGLVGLVGAAVVGAILSLVIGRV